MGRRQQIALGGAGIFAMLALWELASRAHLVNPDDIPPASDVLRALVAQLDEGSFWAALGETMKSTALGLLLGIAIALPLGVVLGLNAYVFRSVRLIVEFLRPIPVVAILPLALLIYGTSLNMKLMLIGFGTTWPLLVQVLYGVQDVDPTLRDTAKSLRIGRARQLTTLVLPSAAPMIATGLRIAAVAALVLSVITELVGGAAGLGKMMFEFGQGAAYDDLYALVIVAGALGIAINAVFARLERIALAWHPTHRSHA